MESGSLFVLEGPDGVGKTTLAKMLVARLNHEAVPSQYFSFPGREPGTLGELVYRLHHNPVGVVGGEVSPTAIQALHVAAHIDVIERQIVPALRSGVTIVLDRYHWSTWVYGLETDANASVLRALIEAEREAWQGHRPNRIFLFEPTGPKREVKIRADQWRGLQLGYRQHASNESELGINLSRIDNSDQTAEETLQEMLRLLSL